METKQKNGKPRYSFLDSAVLIGLIVLLYLIFLLIFGGIERITRLGKADGNDVTLNCVFLAEDMDLELYGIDPSAQDSCPFLHVGDTLYVDGDAIGEVVALDYENCTLPADQENNYGELIYASDPYSMNILITVKADGRESESGYLLGESVVRAGDRMLLSTAGFQREVEIRSVSVWTEEETTDGNAESKGGA